MLFLQRVGLHVAADNSRRRENECKVHISSAQQAAVKEDFDGSVLCWDPLRKWHKTQRPQLLEDQTLHALHDVRGSHAGLRHRDRPLYPHPARQ